MRGHWRHLWMGLPSGAALFVGSCILLLCGCGHGGNGAAVDQPPPASYEILFDGEGADGTRLLWRAPLEGGSPQVLGMTYPGTRPSPRPDGLAIAFASLATAWVPAQLMLIEDLAQPARLLSPPGVAEREAAWSPDGHQLAFYSQMDDGAGDIFIADLDAGDLVNRRNLTPWQPGQASISPDVTPAWSPDGTRIAFTSYRTGGQTLWVMDSHGGQLAELTNVDPSHGDFFPSWSPDGRQLAFQRLALDDSQVGVVPVEGGSPTFFPFPGRAYSPAWSPDGAWIAFSGLVDGEYDIYLQSTTGGELRRLDRSGADHAPAWWRRPPAEGQGISAGRTGAAAPGGSGSRQCPAAGPPRP